jgi:ABC-type thiamine transport system ATPase subunit
MDYAAGKGLIRPDTRINLLGNRIVLIAPKEATITLALTSGLDLTAALGGGRLAMANVDAVPAGKYGKAALEKLGAWAGVRGGAKQRVAIGRALLAHPRLLLMDEPLASLDEARRAEILPVLERLRDEVGVPIVYVSHLVSEVARLASTVVVLDGGRIAAAGSSSQVVL